MCLKRPLSRPWGPPLGLVCAVPTAHRFRPRGFAPPRRFRLTASSGSIAPQYRTGFAAFRDSWNPWTRRSGLSRAVPGSAFTPFEAFPSLAAVPHHYGRCLLDVCRVCAPHARLTTNAALAHSWPDRRIAGPKTYTRRSDGHRRSIAGTARPWTVDRLDPTPSPVRRLPDRTWHTFRCDPPLPFGVDGSRTTV